MGSSSSRRIKVHVDIVALPRLLLEKGTLDVMKAPFHCTARIQTNFIPSVYQRGRMYNSHRSRQLITRIMGKVVATNPSHIKNSAPYGFVPGPSQRTRRHPTNVVSLEPLPMAHQLNLVTPTLHIIPGVLCCINERYVCVWLSSLSLAEGTKVVVKFILLGNGTSYHSHPRRGGEGRRGRDRRGRGGSHPSFIRPSVRPPIRHVDGGHWEEGQESRHHFSLSVFIIPFVWHVLVCTKDEQCLLSH